MHLDDIVAVLTNNDQTVRMYSLPLNVETQVLDLDFPMNHCTVSPDGRTLVAVGDHPKAHFFHREIQDTPPQIFKPHNRLTSASIEWVPIGKVDLHVTRQEDAPTGYFTTAWSPNGRLVALGSEGGYITVLDVHRLAESGVVDQDAIIAVSPSSRADVMNPFPGAVRSMMFSPDPWDLFIWAEDQDRVCIGDLRTGLRSRQIVKIDPKEDGLRRVDIVDVPGDEPPVVTAPLPARDIHEVEADFLRRYRQVPGSPTAVNFATEYIEARRRQRQQRSDPTRSGGLPRLEEPQPGITAREQQLLESLRTSRHREEARAAGAVPRSVNYTSAETYRDPGRNRSPSYVSNTRPLHEILDTVQDSLPELSRVTPRPSSSHGVEGQGALPSLASLQDSGVWSSGSRSSTGTIRQSDGSRLPRRRASVILSGPTSESSAHATATEAEVSRSSGNTSVVTRGGLATPTEESDSNPWRTIEEYMDLARGPLFERSRDYTALQQVEHEAEREQERQALLQQAELEAQRVEVQGRQALLQAEIQAERARARSLTHQRERWRLLHERQAALPMGTASPSAGGISANRARLPFMHPSDRARALLAAGYTETGVRTAGLAMSSDGRFLWAACEDGIFQIEINVKDRLFWPSAEPR